MTTAADSAAAPRYFCFCFYIRNIREARKVSASYYEELSKKESYVFDHLDKAEPAEGGVEAGVDHHDGPPLLAAHTPGLVAGGQLRDLFGHRVEKFVLNKTK